ncbi:hypothetical protein ARMSODRAFT_981532 [Armillaria solidipes]|uniref:Uncharacterized protein n=1 Tax=Armillaria solidipes TaxID=1076256 RepID=A0A2H3ARH2_9AGAR|nr:hypothetical protein ARMSODRAFT_981532 [Armillaria solidipes]
MVLRRMVPTVAGGDRNEGEGPAAVIHLDSISVDDEYLEPPNILPAGSESNFRNTDLMHWLPFINYFLRAVINRTVMTFESPSSKHLDFAPHPDEIARRDPFKYPPFPRKPWKKVVLSIHADKLSPVLFQIHDASGYLGKKFEVELLKLESTLTESGAHYLLECLEKYMACYRTELPKVIELSRISKLQLGTVVNDAGFYTISKFLER